MNLTRIVLILTLPFLIGCGSPEDDWIQLFNGENLDGWHSYGSDVCCDGWYVEDEVLTFDFQRKNETQSSNLVTDEVYTNFELSLEWKIPEKGNSGLFWGVVEDEKYSEPYLTGPEIQILDDNWKEYIEGNGDKTRAGALFGLMAPSTIVSKGAEEWNHYLLHINQGKNIGFLEFNGEEVMRFPLRGSEWDAMVSGTKFEDWEDFGKAMTGHISLQDHGGTVSFRNIKVRELPDQSE